MSDLIIGQPVGTASLPAHDQRPGSTPGLFRRSITLIAHYGPRLASAIGILNPFAAHLAVIHPALAGTMTRSVLALIAGISHALIYAGLGLMFGLSLRPGKEALISQLARKVECNPAPSIQSYTRCVTWLWTVFCLTQLLVSSSLLVVAPLPVWSAFVNLANLPLVIATILMEYAFRRWHFRHLKMASLADTMRVFLRRRANGPSLNL